MSFFFFTLKVSKPALGLSHPPVHWVAGALSFGIKGLERGADYLSRSDVKNT